MGSICGLWITAVNSGGGGVLGAKLKTGVVAHACNPSTWEVEVEGLQVLCQLEQVGKILFYKTVGDVCSMVERVLFYHA